MTFEKDRIIPKCRTDFMTEYNGCEKCRPVKIKNGFLLDTKTRGIKILNGKNTIHLTRSEIEHLQELAERWKIT